MNTDDNNQDVSIDVTDTVESSSDQEIKLTKAEYDELQKIKVEHGSFKRELKEFKKPKETTRDETPKDTTQTSSDLGERAYLAVNGIKSADEIEFFQKMKKETGKSADSLLESTYFQVEFKDFKEKKASSDATPTGSKRSSNSATNTVEYWIAKGELPPASEVQLRRDVVNARIKKEESGGMFYNS